MSSRFDSAVLGSSPVYPNSVVWSEENLVAVASGAVVVILNPANPGARGVITIPSCKPFPVGMIDSADAELLNGCLLPCHLSRDGRPCVRSISWSPVGLANNAGCLLAVCTTGGHVKLYRFPFREFSAEWIEVVDVSELLYNYLKTTSFEDRQIVSSGSVNVIPRRDSTDYESTNDLSDNSPRKSRRTRKRKQIIDSVADEDPDNLWANNTLQFADNVADEDPDYLTENNNLQIVPVSVGKGKPQKKVSEERNLPLITAQQYASRNAMLMSLTVAWSPILGISENGVAIPHDSSNSCSILAVGGKCGRISFWKVNAPECYSIHKTTNSSEVSLVGRLKAHDTWVTAINWALYGSSILKPQFLLVTGSSDGRVKIWQVNGEELLKSSEVIHDSFSLLKEIMTMDSATISVLSLNVPLEASSKLLLAVGKGSGSFEVWKLDISSSEFEKVGCHNAHERIVTGLTWAFDGRCLYSSSQDNSMKSWILVGNSLREVPIPSSNPGSKSSPDVPYVFDSCFGLAVSPGNLAIAVARKFDIALLDPMYQGRTHRAAVEFLWIGGQQLDIPSKAYLDIYNKSYPGLPEKESNSWEFNILWSLNQYQKPSKLLNLWDIVAALLAFKKSSPEYLEHILLKWLTSYFKSQYSSLTALLSEALKFLPQLSSRQLHLINTISRRVVLKECKSDDMSLKQQELEGLSGNKVDDVKLWMELLLSSENELLERLAGFSFSTALSLLSKSSKEFFDVGGWSPDGLQQMIHWVSNGKVLKDMTKCLAAEVRKVKKRKLPEIIEYEANEQCSFCSAVVPFETKEYGICSGVNCVNGLDPKHKLQRCTVTMRILPTKPSWYCICCQKWATKSPPGTLFTMLQYPSDFKSFVESSSYKNSSTPCCPFCGILLQRSQPEHALSSSPV